jgi:hypothetical protein
LNLSNALKKLKYSISTPKLETLYKKCVIEGLVSHQINSNISVSIVSNNASNLFIRDIVQSRKFAGCHPHPLINENSKDRKDLAIEINLDNKNNLSIFVAEVHMVNYHDIHGNYTEALGYQASFFFNNKRVTIESFQDIFPDFYLSYLDSLNLIHTNYKTNALLKKNAELNNTKRTQQTKTNSILALRLH